MSETTTAERKKELEKGWAIDKEGRSAAKDAGSGENACRVSRGARDEGWESTSGRGISRRRWGNLIWPRLAEVCEIIDKITASGEIPQESGRKGKRRGKGVEMSKGKMLPRGNSELNSPRCPRVHLASFLPIVSPRYHRRPNKICVLICNLIGTFPRRVRGPPSAFAFRTLLENRRIETVRVMNVRPGGCFPSPWIPSGIGTANCKILEVKFYEVAIARLRVRDCFKTFV